MSPESLRPACRLPQVRKWFVGFSFSFFSSNHPLGQRGSPSPPPRDSRVFENKSSKKPLLTWGQVVGSVEVTLSSMFSRGGGLRAEENQGGGRVGGGEKAAKGCARGPPLPLAGLSTGRGQSTPTLEKRPVAPLPDSRAPTRRVPSNRGGDGHPDLPMASDPRFSNRVPHRDVFPPQDPDPRLHSSFRVPAASKGGSGLSEGAE